MAKKKKQIPVKVSREEAQVKDFFDMIAPTTMKFNADYFICGDTYRSVWAIREYPPQTSSQAILCHLLTCLCGWQSDLKTDNGFCKKSDLY